MKVKLGIGAVQIGLEYGINNKTGKPDADTALDILSFAVDQGIYSFDTVVAYGNSEEILGRFINCHPSRTIKKFQQRSNQQMKYRAQ